MIVVEITPDAAAKVDDAVKERGGPVWLSLNFTRADFAANPWVRIWTHPLFLALCGVVAPVVFWLQAFFVAYRLTAMVCYLDGAESAAVTPARFMASLVKRRTILVARSRKRGGSSTSTPLIVTSLELAACVGALAPQNHGPGCVRLTPSWP